MAAGVERSGCGLSARLTATVGHCREQTAGQDRQRPPQAGRADADHRGRRRWPFLRPLPVRTLYGVGRVTEAGAAPGGLAHGGRTCRVMRGICARLVGSFAGQAEAVCVWPGRPAAGIRAMRSRASAARRLSCRTRRTGRCCGPVCGRRRRTSPARLKHRRLGAHTVQVKVRYGDFTTLTRQSSGGGSARLRPGEIYRLGCYLLGRERLVSRPLRLLGLGVSNLREPTARQLTLL
jgi:DNA polymerase-4